MHVGEGEDQVVEKLELLLLVLDFADDDEGLYPFVGQQRLREFPEELFHEGGEVVDAHVAPIVARALTVVLLFQMIA